MRMKIKCLLILLTAVLMSSCYNQRPTTPDAWNLSDRQLDSISFYTTHHYTRNFNFIVASDSILLSSQSPDELPFDTIAVYAGERLVVADIMTMSSDSIDSTWVKVARDQASQGWLRECELLKNVEPDDPISRFINTFSDSHLLVFLALVAVTLAVYSLRWIRRRHAFVVHYHDIPSFYPALLALLVAVSATLYASIQLFAPDSWRHFYYHPTLNPLSLPLHLSLFISSVWLILIVSIAAVDDTLRHLSLSDAMLYLVGLASVCAVNYVVFSVSTLYYIGYPLLIAYAYYAIRRMR